MAYAAVISLRHIIEQQLLSHQISIPYPKAQIQSLHTKICSLQDLLKEQNTVHDDFETQIRDAAYAAEDILESHISNHFLPSGHEYDGSPGDLQKLLKDLDAIQKKAAKMADQKISLTRIVSSRSSALTDEGKFVGNKDGLSQLKDQLVGESSKLRVVSVVGMAGIGKTAIVDQVYDDKSIEQFFHFRAKAIIGPNYLRRDVLLALLNSVDHRVVSESNQEIIDDAQLTDSIYKNLKGRRYLIVLYDLRDIKAWDDLKILFPDDGNGSRIMLTTKMRKVAFYAAGTKKNVHQIRFLDKDESWDLLCGLVFGTEPCPSQLLKIGKTIAQNCQGLPLTIVLLGEFLKRKDKTDISDVEKTQENWKKVADSLTSAVQSDTDDVGWTSVMQFLKDEHLPQHLKACFLYMGAFPLNYEIPTTRLIQLWVAEGFLESKESRSLEEVAKDCLEELVDRSLVLVHMSKSSGRGIKTCSVHSAVWHLCVNAAEKDKFYSAFTRYVYDTTWASPQSTVSSRRRLCIRKNVLFGIEDVRSAIASVSTARSLLCIGPEHLRPLRVCLDFRFLRVLNALTIRFYEFPNEILKLIQLRFLALTYNGEDQIPGSICKLWNLQFLIVSRHLSIKSNGSVPSYLPIEIWNMKQLRHLQITGSDLMQPDDPSHGALLENLLTLSDVTGHSCTKEVFERTQNLKKLGVRIELAEIDASSTLCLFDHIALLFKLESFKCVILNPDHRSSCVVIARPRPDLISTLPTLKKLTLSGCGFPWEDMKIFARMPNLEALKLLCYAFRGPEWEIDVQEFEQLKFLLLEDMDIKKWIARGQILPRLERLTIRHCYKLQEIPGGIDGIATLRMLEVVDCSPSVVTSAMRVKQMQEDLSNDDLQVRIESSWIEKTKKSSGHLGSTGN